MARSMGVGWCEKRHRQNNPVVEELYVHTVHQDGLKSVVNLSFTGGCVLAFLYIAIRMAVPNESLW